MQVNLTNAWYKPKLNFLTLVLLPFSWLFAVVVSLRRWLFHSGILKVHHFPVPIIVVGNITVGGTGKTPCVTWLARFLKEQGYRPGIVSRGIGGKKQFEAYSVETNSPVKDVGDEALLLLKNSECPVVVCIDRVAAVKHLLLNSSCNIVISDDGLQHYRLGRDLEIALVDGVRRFGNKQLLPAGPLRESIARLKKVDWVIINGGNENDQWVMNMDPVEFISVKESEKKFTCDTFPYKKIHALAGIGHPQRFFLSLERLGLEVIPHVFKDHHLYQADELIFAESYPIVMTEKDAIKCQNFAKDDY